MHEFQQHVERVTGEIANCLQSISVDAVDRALITINSAPRLFIAGAGRSGLAMRAFAMRLMHLGKECHFLGDVTTPSVAAGDLLIVGSGSGSTETLQAVAKRAKSLQANILLFTIMPDSPIAILADHVVRIPAPSTKAMGATEVVSSIQPMGSLFEQCLLLLTDIIILMLMQRRDTTLKEICLRHANLE